MQHNTKNVRLKARGSLLLLAALAVTFPASGLAATQTRTSAFEYDASGQLVKEIVEPGNSDLCLVTSYTYDAYSNKTASATRNCNGSAGSNPGVNSEAAAPSGNAVFAPRSASSAYDARGQFPLTSTNALNQSETRTFDARFGKAASLTGPNGLTTTWEYDGFGRKTKETRADGTISTWAYALCAGCGGLSNTAYTITATSTGAPTRITYFDSLDREIRNQTTGFDGTSVIYQDTIYDNLGRVSQKSKTYYVGQTIYWTRFSYDALGRVVSETAPDNTTSTIAYSGLTTRVTNAKNQVQTKTKNTRGQLASVTDALGNTLTYSYDPNGNLLTTKDANNNIVTLTYDLRGRKTAMADPDMGNWQYRYNALGELVGQTDAKGQVSSMTYDLLGRMLQRNEPDLVSNWYYDKKADGSICGKGVGKLCEAKADNGYRRTHNYDALGRPNTSSTTLDTAYNDSVTYDALGRLDTRTWPTGFAVKHVYTALGYLKEVRNNATNALYWQANTFDAEGHLLTQTHGNNVITQRTYDPASGRLSGILAGAGNGVQNLAYTYDTLGNLATRQDNAAASQESFTYDSLNRLTTYSLQGGGVSGIVTRTVAYDAIGNITSKSDAGTYYYAPNTPPHAVTSVTGGPTKTYAHTYDANGNLIYTAINTLSNGQTATRFESYTSFNMPLTLSHGPAGQAATATLSFVYGPEHQRTKQVSNISGTTYYLNETSGAPSFEKEIKPSGVTENKHYISAGGVVLALYTSRTNGVNDTRYFHLDHLGSTSVITSEAGAVVERLAYDPWGKRQYANGGTPPEGYTPATTDRGFTMHEHLDEMGIIHMNGRVYDPTLGRFMSADPYIQAPDNQLSYNRYAYCIGNPLVCSDPSGYNWWSKNITHNKAIRTVVAVVAAFYVGPLAFEWAATSLVGSVGGTLTWSAAGVASASGTLGVVSGAVAGAAGGFTAGLIASGNIQGAFKGAASGALFGAAGGVGGEGWDMSRLGAHAAAGCAMGEISGGGCGSGALSAVAGKMTTIATNGNLVGTIIAGGVASAVGGGKFANGAATAAFGYLFNWCAHNDCLNVDGMKMETQLYPRTYVDKDSLAICNQGGGPCIGVGPGSMNGVSKVSAVIAETMAGKGNFVSSLMVKADELLAAGLRFLGQGYQEIGQPGSGVFRSADGLRQFRIDSNSLTGSHAPGVPHGHLEIYRPGAARPSVNNHIPFQD